MKERKEMDFNIVAKQRAYIVSEFDGAVQAQRNVIAERLAAGDGSSEYFEGWLKILEVGLAKAQETHHIDRFAFKAGAVSESRLLIELLFELKTQVDELEPADTSARTGMMDVLDNWVTDLLRGDALQRDHVILVDAEGQRWLVPENQRLLIPQT